MDPSLLAVVEKLTEQERAFLTMVGRGFLDMRNLYTKPNGEACFRAQLKDGGISTKYVELKMQMR